MTTFKVDIQNTCARTTSLFNTCMTSSMFLGPTISIARVKTFLQISILGDDRARRMSMSISWTTCSHEYSLTLLNYSFMKHTTKKKLYHVVFKYISSKQKQTLVWCFFNSDKRSNTINLTLLSEVELSNVAYV